MHCGPAPLCHFKPDPFLQRTLCRKGNFFTASTLHFALCSPHTARYSLCTPCKRHTAHSVQFTTHSADGMSTTVAGIRHLLIKFHGLGSTCDATPPIALDIPLWQPLAHTLPTHMMNLAWTFRLVVVDEGLAEWVTDRDPASSIVPSEWAATQCTQCPSLVQQGLCHSYAHCDWPTIVCD